MSRKHGWFVHLTSVVALLGNPLGPLGAAPKSLA